MRGMPSPRLSPWFSLVIGSTVFGLSGICLVALATPSAMPFAMDESNLPLT